MHNQAELAYRRLRERLIAGRYNPGDRLTELGICEDLGMSRTPVREALRRLQSDGLVASTGRGVVVSSLSEEDMRHATDLQGALEALAARLAATAQRDGHLSPAQMRQFEAAGRHVEERGAAGDVEGTWKANLDFHMMLARLSGNPLLEDALERIWARFSIVSRSNISRRTRLNAVHHAMIVRAISEGDPEAAACAAADHAREASITYSRNLASGD
ncbi:HTH-type transcriptional regulator McbR [Streptomyces jeddahensis]|uniref:HTH-type transcriptional regulator McbR n=2 Tax=Streptomyces jeddahensis TaxID=1716141 RepID=A0A177HMW5_9ACTN|nr:HTH-type transcriptional regulator McbR [Streptomyces jeddahensis]